MTFDRTRQLRVGLLVVACSVTFVTLIGFIAGSALQRDQDSYFILFDENVKGMVVGSKVNFQGVPIGAVRDILFQAGRTQVEVLVDPERAEIQDVTVARLDRLLVTGQVTVELEGWDETASSLPPNSFIEAASVDPIQELKTSLPAVLDRVDAALQQSIATMQRVDLLMSDHNLDRLERTLANLEQASATLPDRLAATADEARATLAAFRPLVGDARDALGDLTAAADRAVAVAERAGVGVDEALGDARRALVGFEEMAGGFARLAGEAEGLLGNNRQAIRSMLIGAADAARELQSFARQLRAAPNAVLFGTNQDEIDVPATPPARGGDR